MSKSHKPAYLLTFILALLLIACSRQTTSHRAGQVTPTANHALIAPTWTPSTTTESGCTPSPQDIQAVLRLTPVYSNTDVIVPWAVDIVQDERILPEENGQIRLQKKPFTVRVHLPGPLSVELAAFEDQQVFKCTKPGIDVKNCVLPLDCNMPFPFPFCWGAQYGDKFNKEEGLVIHAEWTRYLYYESECDHAWNKVAITTEGYIFEFKVSIFSFPRDIAISGREYDLVPIEQFERQKLYIMLLGDYKNRGTIDVGELKKITLSFE